MWLTRRDFLKTLSSGSFALCLLPLRREEVAAQADELRLRADRPNYSGVYPHLAYFNQENECGTGAVVPWAGRLWVITYAPHQPRGSTDKLYEIDEQLNLSIRPESVGGTPANRMIHRESQQLFIGPYVIDREGRVRAIPPRVMPGRLTGTARHLFDPANKVYFATMEEGFYEVDVHTLAVTMLYPDGNEADPGNIGSSLLPGYHGKGLYSGQGRLVYANNGETGPLALQRPDIPSGVLAEWDGKEWTVVRRNQFTEVSGPGGIAGNQDPDAPIWSYGWDHRSAILMLRDGGRWHSYRMPKASHTYDGAHGWHTEWPRIRDIGRPDLLMTMHGMFWSFPRHFSSRDTAGIRPLSTYLKIIGDFCEWNGRVVMGADDAAKGEFARNPIRTTGGTMVEQSNSNLWFVDPETLSGFGVPLGRGGPWVNDAVPAGSWSDPFHFAGFDHRLVHIRHDADRPVTFSFEVDVDGSGRWSPLARVVVPARGYVFHRFPDAPRAEWIRVQPDRAVGRLTLTYQFADRDRRPTLAAPLFQGLARPGVAFTSGVVRPAGQNRGTLQFAAQEVSAAGQVRDLGYYEVDAEMRFRRVESPESFRELIGLAPRELPYEIDAASVVVTDLEGKRWRLPRGSATIEHLTRGVLPRTLREVVTERSLLSVQGHVYELPRANSGGFAKIRPVATSELLIMDLCSWRGLLVLAGIATGAPANPHIVRSEDGRTALWFGVVDDLWRLGKPRGRGGPWKDAAVRAGESSDPYLMTGYARKELTLSHAERAPVRFTVEVDLTGDGEWVTYRELEVAPGRPLLHRFPEGFNAYWVRLTASGDARATAEFRYS